MIKSSCRINFEEAQKSLLWAFENSERCPLNNIEMKKLENIKIIINGTHKTYRYILITALLAKSTSDLINPISIQASAPISGAYDARSLCHKVIVPFERKFLNGALGNSNEPFLNKPARCTHLSMDNPVRSGNDRLCLELLIETLTNIQRDEAKKCLCYAISLLIEIGNKQKINNENLIRNFSTSLELYHFMRRLLEKSCEGEICALLVGTMEKLFYSIYDTNYHVICHKINESGSSSQEIGDIDIFYKNTYYYSIEVKDKNFTSDDLDFALNKMFLANAISGAFIYGPRASFDKQSVQECILRYENEKFIVIFENIFDYLKYMLSRIFDLDFDKFRGLFDKTSNEMNIKSNTRIWIDEVGSS